MTRKKKAAGNRGPKPPPKSKGAPKFAPRVPRNANAQSSSFNPYTPSPHKPSAFTLADEARNTERSHAFWNSDLKLRTKHVVFVSAGHLHGEQPKGIEDTPDEDKEDTSDVSRAAAMPDVAMAQMTLESDSSSSTDNIPNSLPGITTPADDTEATTANLPPSSFFVDTAPRAVATGMPPPIMRDPSPTPSDSSEEVVLFKGRNNIAQPPTARHAPQAISTGSQSVASLPNPKVGRPLTTQTKPSSQPTARQLPAKLTAGGEQAGSSREVPSSLLRNHVQDKPAWDTGSTPWESKSTPGIGWLAPRHKPQKYDPHAADRAAARDYLANIRLQQLLEVGDLDESDFAEAAFAQRTLSLDDGNDWQPMQLDKPVEEKVVRETTSVTFARETATVAPNNASDKDEWDSVMLDDFEDQSTSDDVIGPINRVVSKRTRRSGTQYLVVYEGMVTDDARWLPATFLISEHDNALVWDYETKLSEKERLQRLALETSDSDLISSDEEDDEEDFQDEKDLIARRLERMNDEQIAQRLAKQEELGLGSDEVLLYEGDDAMDGDPELEEEGFLVNTAFALSSRSRPKSKRARGDFPSASLMADVLEQDPYNGFDIMDTERPSLKKKSKGRRGQFPVEISDSDLESQVRATWEADRRKKSEYKKARQESRAAGTLGKAPGDKPNLAIKYSDGFTMEEILEEIRVFLISDHESLALPPMEAHERAHLHRFAKKMDIATKSVGQGANRFMNIAKTTRTRPYDDDEFDSVMAKFRRVHSRPGDPGYGKKIPGKRTLAKRASTTVRTARPVVSYKDGEVVGGGAPEIGANNKGHALLQKMGWTKGMALGALDNKGILHPIAHTVKSGKGGLK